MFHSCCFAGHADLRGEGRALEYKLEMLIRCLIEQHGVRDFYSGSMGTFDRMAEGVVYRLKEEFPQIRLYKVLAYYSPDLHKTQEGRAVYDEIIFPFDKWVHPKGAIILRNRWMVDHCAHIVAFVTKTYGGAHKTLTYAKKRGKTNWNLADGTTE